MVDNYKVVCNTAAGRRRYMQYLIPQVVCSDIVDRYDIWVNTMDKQDIEFFQVLAAKYPKINLVYQPDGVVSGISSINAFYRTCVEEDTIYFKLDDDIVWLEPDLIAKMVRFRIDNPDYFLVSPLVINNSISTYMLQVSGKIELDKYYGSKIMGQTFYRSGDFAAKLHKWFLDSYLKQGRYAELHCGLHPQAMSRFSINSILWFGHEMKKFDGVVPGDDEEWLSLIKPTMDGRANCFNGDAIIAHFAFWPQRKVLDSMGILEEYGEYLHAQWAKDATMSVIDATVQDAMKYVEENCAEILKKPDIYVAGAPRSAIKKSRAKRTFMGNLVSLKLPIIKTERLGNICGCLNKYLPDNNKTFIKR